MAPTKFSGIPGRFKSFYCDRGWMLGTFLVTMGIGGSVIETLRYGYRFGLMYYQGSCLHAMTANRCFQSGTPWPLLLGLACSIACLVMVLFALSLLTYPIALGLGAKKKDAANCADKIHECTRRYAWIGGILVAATATFIICYGSLVA
jgi:hypothetical protein